MTIKKDHIKNDENMSHFYQKPLYLQWFRHIIVKIKEKKVQENN